MYDQIKKMMNAYHTFASYPSLIDVQTLMPAVKKGQILLPMASKLKGMSADEIVDVLNDQWLNMSNTSQKSLSVNLMPRIAHGLTFGTYSTKDVLPQDCIVVCGAKSLLANYLVCSGDKSADGVYFSIKDNEFLQSSYEDKDSIPVKKLFGTPKLRLKSKAPADNELQARFNDSKLNRILDEIREKWETFVFPVNICHGLTDWEQDGWQNALKGD